MKIQTTNILMTIVLLCFVPILGMAEEVEIDGIRYSLIKKIKEATVISKDDKYSGDIVIPPLVRYGDVDYSVITIGSYAFKNCDALKSIEIPNSIQKVEDRAFDGCSKLKKVNISDLTAWCNISFEGGYSNPLKYAHLLYLDNELITNLEVPDDVTSIGANSFCNCTSITSVKIPNSVTTIGNYAFYECTNLITIEMGENVESIGYGAFCNCANLETINIPFGVPEIIDYTFYGCTSLTSINVPSSVKKICWYAFANCKSLNSISIPNSVIGLEGHSFENCSSMNSINIPNSVLYIKDQAFYGCITLKDIIIGSGLSSIGKSAFFNCSDLESFTIHATFVPNTQSDAFNGSYIEYSKLIVPDESIEAYKANEPWKNFGIIEGLSGYVYEKEKCATPTIHYANGKITFECETEGVTYQSTITNPDVSSYYGNDINLGGTYYVKVYATKEGYEDSDEATATINLLEGAGSSIIGDVDGDGLVNMMDVTEIINIILGK